MGKEYAKKLLSLAYEYTEAVKFIIGCKPEEFTKNDFKII